MSARKAGLGLILLLGALETISPLSIDMYLPAFQQIAALFNTTGAKVSLTLSSYFIGMALGQVFYGPLLDRYGRKPPLYFGLSVYIVSSVACIYAPNLNFLIGMRFLQALGGCAAQVTVLAMIRDLFSPKESAKVFSQLMLVLSVSPMLAPTIGGLVVAAWGWKAVFWVLAAMVSTIMVLVATRLPESHKPDPTVALNPVSITKGFAMILRSRQFSSYAFSGAFSFAGLFAYVAAAPSIFMEHFGIGARGFGIIFAVLSVGLVGGGQVNVQLEKRFTSVGIYRASLYVQLVTAVVFTLTVMTGLALAKPSGIYFHVVPLFIFLSCVGLTYPNAAAIAMAPFEKNAGSASSLLGFLQMSVGALAAAGFSVLKGHPSMSVSVLFLISAILALALVWKRR